MRSIQKLNIRDVERTPPPALDWVLPGLAMGHCGAVVAPGGCSKTTLATQLALTVAGGGDLIGLDAEATPLRTGRVLMLALEESARELQGRLHQLFKTIQLSYPPERYLQYVEKAAANYDCRPASRLKVPFDIMETAGFEWLLEAASGARLVVIDTLRRCHSLDENSSAEMAAVLQRLEYLSDVCGCSVLVLHHTNKISPLQGQGDSQHASRGSSVIPDHLRWQSYLAPLNGEEIKALKLTEDEARLYVKWGLSKQNYGSPVQRMYLRRHSGGILLPVHLQSPIDSRRRTSAAIDMPPPTRNCPAQADRRRPLDV